MLLDNRAQRGACRYWIPYKEVYNASLFHRNPVKRSNLFLPPPPPANISIINQYQVCMPIPLPDRTGREQILAIHLRKARDAGLVSPDVDDASLAGETESFSGADLAGLVRSAISFAIADWRARQAQEFVDTPRESVQAASEVLKAGGQGGETAPWKADGIEGGSGGGGAREGEEKGGGAGLVVTVDNFERAMLEVAMTSGRGGGGGRGRLGMLGSRLLKTSKLARRMAAIRRAE